MIFLYLRLSPYVIQVILGAVSVAGTIPALVRPILFLKGVIVTIAVSISSNLGDAEE